MGDSLVPRPTDVSICSRRLASVPATAAYLSVAARTVWSWVYARKIPVIRIGGTVRIDLNELEKLLDAGTIPALER